VKFASMITAAALLGAIPAPVFAQAAGFSDDVCFGTVLFSADKATDADSRKIIGMLEFYYLGKLRTSSPGLDLSAAVSSSLAAFEKEADKATAAKGCIGSIQADLAKLDSLNESMSKGK